MDDELMAVPVPLETEPTAALDEDQHDPAKKIKLDGVPDKEHDDATHQHHQHHQHHHHHHDAHAADAESVAVLVASAASGPETVTVGASPVGTPPATPTSSAEGAHETDGGSTASTSGRRRARMPRTRTNEKGEPIMMLPSFIWDFFVKDPTGKFVVCTLCPDQSTRFAYSGGTSTMNRHLRKKHQKFAPGKSAADYELAKSSKRSVVGSPRVGNSAVPAGLVEPPVSLGSLSPGEAGRRQLLDLRNSRRRAPTKRRKLHPGLLDTITDHAAVAYGHSAADFDPSAFVSLPGNAASPGAGLQFPPGFELGDSMEMAGAGLDPRLFEYNPLAGTLNFRTRRNGPNQKVLTHRLLKYLIAQYEPLDVSRMGMELNVLLYGTDYPSSKLPSEDTLKLALANLYYSQREILKEVIAEVEVLSLSLNNWKSVFGQNVLTVSGHWISNGFSRRDCVLEVYVLPLDESVNTIALLRDVMDKWDIAPSKVAALTMIKNGKEEAIHEEYPGLWLVNCFVNILDSAVAAGLQKCAPLIRRCRNYVSYFIQNPSEYQIFLALQRKMAEASAGLHEGATEHGSHVSGAEDEADKAVGASPKISGVSGGAFPAPTPVLSVICDFENRWNSTSEMICRIVELEQMLLLYKNSLESDTNPNRRPMQLRFVCCELSADEWSILKELARLLEPIEGVVHVSNLEYPGLSIVYPLLHSIKKHLDDAALWVSTSLVAAVRNAIVSGLEMRLCTSGTAPSSPYLSCLLAPRFKTLPFVGHDERDRIVEMLKILHAEMIGDKENVKDGTSEHEKKAKAAKKQALLNEFFPLDEPINEIDKLKSQVTQYLDSPSLPATDESENDPLEWWSRYQRMFPFLAKLAKKYLCISAVSLPFYEAFTNYGQLMKEKKARLDIEVAAQILFCRSVSRIPEMDRMNV
ncbi:TPA: hypothetical protein N0F65_003127 [Lagenidium giganteum]|uniref:Transposase n=1 Tax=Lagenidium giganteum TaxID=4803 RepID=A0AAV2YWX3_9STRA|nr:TPA: hypothetical protein N0F65_003127 [Lagenidium giganteum]